MSIPSHEDEMLPILTYLADENVRYRREVAEYVAYHFDLTPEERAAVIPSGKSTVVRSRTGWALSYMKQAGLVRLVKRGWYEITQEGLAALREAPGTIDNNYLTKFEAFNEFRRRSRPTSGDDGELVDPAPKPTRVVRTPDEELDQAYLALRSASVGSLPLDDPRFRSLPVRFKDSVPRIAPTRSLYSYAKS